MKKLTQLLPCIAILMQAGLHSYGQANTNLNNLTATSINQSLLPNANNTLNLGSSGNSWMDGYFDGVIFIDDKRFIGNKGTGNTFTGSEAGISTNGNNNTMIGHQAGFSNTGGNRNTFMGSKAGYKNKAGDGNVFIGYVAGYTNTDNFNLVFIGDSAGFANGGQSGDPGDNNTFIGNSAGQNNDASARNTFIGSYAGYKHSIENDNTFIGYSAGKSHGEGNSNTFVGSNAGYSASSGYRNSFFGSDAGYKTTGESNAFFGKSAGYNNSAGSHNCYIGYQSAYTSTSGNYNVAIGDLALYDNTTGGSNAAVGPNALWNNTTGSGNAALGQYALNNNSTGSYNVGVGWWASTSSSYTNSSSLGYFATSTASNQVRLGNSSVTSIGGYVGWTNVSDGRYKKNVKDEIHGLDFILKLRPVIYNLDISGIENYLHRNQQMPEGVANPFDEPLLKEAISTKEQLIYSGFIAQEVEEAAKEVGYNFSGIDAPKNEDDLYGLRYAEFVVPLVKAMQELHKELKDQGAILKTLEEENEELRSEMDDLKSLLTSSTSVDIPLKMTTGRDQFSTPQLGQNIPNPFDNSTLIPFSIPEDCDNASIVIMESGSGKIVRRIPVTCGQTLLTVEAGLLHSGTYTYALLVDGITIDSKNMVLTK